MCATSLILVAILAQTLPSPSVGDPQDKAQAKTLLSQGTKLYEQGDVAGALDKFLAAYAAFPSPKLMFNIGEANRDLHRPVEALEAFEKFLAGAPDAASETLADVRKSVAQLQRQLGQIRINCMTSGTEVSVDGKRVGLTPLPDLVWAIPGHHQVAGKHKGVAPAVEEVDVKAGSVSSVTMHLVATVAAAPVLTPAAAPALDLRASATQGDASEGWWRGRKWTWVAGGSTVLLAVGAITAGLSMQSKFDSLHSSCGSASQSTVACSKSDIDSVTTLKNTANIFWGLAGAAAVTTGVLFFVEGRPVAVAPLAGQATGFIASVRY
jgi:hypothetical protein